MSDALLPYYEHELDAIRRLAAEFADTHPKIAGRLRISPDTIDDPHVERLIEGAAFLAARVHHRLDDEFPEVTDALLGVLYPHYLAPLPSAAIVQFETPSDLALPVHLKAGLELETEPVGGEVCRFRTTWPLALWPIEVESVRLSGLPLAAPANPLAARAVAVLRIVVKCRSADISFARLEVDCLRFFLRGAFNTASKLYELLCNHTIALAYADDVADPIPAFLPTSEIEPAGFAPDEALLPWTARSFVGFRLLTEYFAFPEKFLFVDFRRIEAKTLLSGGNRLEIFVYLDHTSPELERSTAADSMALGCTPIVNLFSQRCEPIALTHTDTEYRVVPDARRPTAMEVWQIDRVRESVGDGTQKLWQPFYRLGNDGSNDNRAATFYHAVRRETASSALSGSEIYVAPHDPDFDPGEPAQSVLSVEATCFNRELPASLPFGAGRPEIRLVEDSATISRIACLTAPTVTLRRPLRERRFWHLVSHLSLGHLSIVGGAEGAAALREILQLYDLRDSAESRAAIQALVGVSAASTTARVQGARPASFCRGLDVMLEFDPRAWQDGGLYMLAAVIGRFLALHATVNSFVRTSAIVRGRSGPAAAWPARAGMRVLL